MPAENPATSSDCLLFHSIMVRIKVTPGAGQRKGSQVEAQAPSALPSPEELQRRKGSSRVLLDQPPGRCKSMCYQQETCYNYAQRY